MHMPRDSTTMATGYSHCHPYAHNPDYQSGIDIEDPSPFPRKLILSCTIGVLKKVQATSFIAYSIFERLGRWHLHEFASLSTTVAVPTGMVCY